jgi:hypothetical protein
MGTCGLYWFGNSDSKQGSWLEFRNQSPTPVWSAPGRDLGPVRRFYAGSPAWILTKVHGTVVAEVSYEPCFEPLLRSHNLAVEEDAVLASDPFASDWG